MMNWTDTHEEEFVESVCDYYTEDWVEFLDYHSPLFRTIISYYPDTDDNILIEWFRSWYMNMSRNTY
jgi:hypothetical protein